LKQKFAFLCVFLLATGIAACQSSNALPASFVSGLRVLAIKAEPPEVPAGASSTATMLAVDTSGRAITMTWSECLLPPRPGEAVNPDCITSTTASFLAPIGAGPTVSATMPQVTAAELGQPDSTGGVYLPLVAGVSTDADSLVATYRLRLAQSTTVNHNPTVSAVFVVSDAGNPTLDEAVPLIVHAGDQITLGDSFASGSAENYMSPAAGGAVVAETLTTSWFCTAGQLSVEKTGGQQPTTVLRLDARLPAAGAIIDLWAVGRDERGGTDYVHRTLQLQ
jgi:hypothetical protein